MVETRPDIAFTTSIASRYTKNLSHLYIKAVKKILRYLKSSKDWDIVYGGGTLDIKGYSDSDWAKDKESRKSISGYIFMLNGGPVSWCSKRQVTVALSTIEAEYITLILAAKEATWLRLLLTESDPLQTTDQYAEISVQWENTGVKALKNDAIQPLQDDCIDIKGDNQGSIALAHNLVFHTWTKYINIQHYYIRDEVFVGKINLTYISMADIIADGLTKPLMHTKFHKFVR